MEEAWFIRIEIDLSDTNEFPFFLAFPGGAYFVRSIFERPVQSLDASIQRRDPASRQARLLGTGAKDPFYSLSAGEPKGEFEFTWFPAPYKVFHPLCEVENFISDGKAVTYLGSNVNE